MSRFACVLVEHIVAAAHERCEPRLAEEPLVVVSGTAPARRVVEANRPAHALGVRPGMTETEAETRVAGLVVRPLSEARAAAAHQALLEAAFAVSPRVEDRGPGMVQVDLGGLTRLHGGEAAIAGRLLRGVRAVGLAATVGVAGTRRTALVAARVAAASSSSPDWAARLVADASRRELAGMSAGRFLIIPEGEEREGLTSVPLDVLDLPAHVAETLTRWGIRTLGELAAVPRDGLAVRLGPAGLAAQDEALGRDHVPFRPWAPPAVLEEAQELDWEITTWPELEPVVTALLARVTARLAGLHRWAGSVRLECGLANRSVDVRTITFASPLREPAPMRLLIARELESRPPTQPIIHVGLALDPVRVEAAQGKLGVPPSPPVRELAEILGRLVSLVGPESVGSPVVLDSHRADPVALGPFLPPPADDAAEQTDTHLVPVRGHLVPVRGHLVPVRGHLMPVRGHLVPVRGHLVPVRGHLVPVRGHLAFRRLRPPRRVEIMEDEPAESAEAGEAPRVLTPKRMRVRIHDAVGGLSAPQTIVVASGPWRTSGEWWDLQAWARDEWDVALADGRLCRLVRDRRTGTWWLDGAYD